MGELRVGGRAGSLVGVRGLYVCARIRIYIAYTYMRIHTLVHR